MATTRKPKTYAPKGSGIFGIGGSDSSANDNRQSAGDAGQNIRGNSNQVVLPGSTLLDFRSAKLNTAPTITGNKGGVVINDIGAVSDLASKFTDAISGITQQTNQTLSNALGAQNGQVSDALNKVSDASANASTGGDTDRNKIILYIVLGLFALLGVWLYRHK
jgi:hypothetical protein